MSVDNRTMALWEMEYLKCQTKNSLKNYIQKYANEPRNPYVNKAKKRLNESTFTIKNNKSHSGSNSNNWFKDNVDLLVKFAMIVVVIGGAYFIEEAYSNWRKKRNAEYHKAQMESILRQSVQSDQMIKVWNDQLQKQLNTSKNDNSDDVSSINHNHNNHSTTNTISYYDYSPFNPYDLNYNEVINEYNYEVASRQTPQEFLNERWGSECKSCHGTKKCPACNGSKIASSFGNTYKCEVCNENGDCPACGGSGLASWNR